MPLLAINNLDSIIEKAGEWPDGLPIVKLPGTGFHKSILKLKPGSCCEVLGYQLARRLQVPVMPAIPLWCPSASKLDGNAIGEGRIGLGIEFAKPFDQISWEQATSMSKETVAASLALCMLDRYEWGQFAATTSGLVLYDLERLLPAFVPELIDGQTWCDVAKDVSNAAEIYRSLSYSFVHDVLEEADRLQVSDSLVTAIADAARISVTDFMDIFDLRPHPLAEKLQ
jgi:hypothetical protein